MNLVLYTHPEFLGLKSQNRFAAMLVDAYRARGHRVQLRQPRAVLRRRLEGTRLAKWAGYVDQYLLFPWAMRAGLRADPPQTLYVFCDQALGPWVPGAAHRPHVVHCHDLLALRSALGEVAENPTRLSGRLYQQMIRRGFRHARHFISVSRHTQQDLHRLGGVRPVTSEVVYNGLNHPYRPLSADTVDLRLVRAGLPTQDGRCLLHVGSAQWYKNPVGVVKLYAAHVRDAHGRGEPALPLWMVSPPPDERLRAALADVPQGGVVRFFQGVSTDTLEALYSHARALLFPSLAEGFGWPIAEALACGCPVLTTGEAPMTEVGGDAAVYLPRMPGDASVTAWAEAGAHQLREVLSRDAQARMMAAEAGWRQAARFSPERAIDAYLDVYAGVLKHESAPSMGATRHDAAS